MPIYYKGNAVGAAFGAIPSGQLNIDQNGIYDVTKLSSVDVDVQPVLQSKVINIFNNGREFVEPDPGFDGLNRIEIVTNIEGYRVAQMIEGDFCTFDLTSLSDDNTNNDDPGGGSMGGNVESIPELPTLLEYQYSGNNVELNGMNVLELKSSLIVLNMEGNTRIMFNLFISDEMGNKNSLFTCANWDSVSHESGGYRILFNDPNYGNFQVMVDPSNLNRVVVYMYDSVQLIPLGPALELTSTHDSFDNLILRHHYYSDDSSGNSVQIVLDYINQTASFLYQARNDYSTNGSILYNDQGQAYYEFNLNEDITAIDYSVMFENYILFPQLNDITFTCDSITKTKTLYSDLIYLQVKSIVEVN